MPKRRAYSTVFLKSITEILPKNYGRKTIGITDSAAVGNGLQLWHYKYRCVILQ